MMRILFILLFSSVFVPYVHAGQYFEWVSSGGGTLTDRANAIHTDVRGYSAITGGFNGNIALGSVNLNGGSGLTFYVAVFDSLGSIQWARSSTGTGNIQGMGVTRDGSGNIIATGYFNGTVTIGTTSLTSSGNDDIFIAKYSSSGNFLWAIKAGGGSVDQGFAITADASGNIYSTGYFSGTGNFGSLSMTAAFYDAFVVKWDASGNALWARKGGGSSTDYGRGVTVDVSGNVFMSGDIYGTGVSTFDGLTVNGSGAYDAFLVKYDNSGTVQWLRTGGGSLNDRANAVAADASGNVYITGFLSSSVSFSSTNISSLGDQDVFLAKYDGNGALQWIRQAGNSFSTNVGYGVVTDASGMVYVTGTFQNTINFGALSMQSLGLDPFIAKYTSTGNPIWIQRGGSGNDDEGKGIGVDTAGHTYITGWFQNTNSPFGVHTLNSMGVEDIFIARLDSGVVTLNPVQLVYCAGDTILVPYQAYGDFLPLNNFTAQLSNASGSFVSPVSLGILSGQASSTISGVIPVGTPAGTGYRVRVNGTTNPATGRMNTFNITIKALPSTPAPIATVPVCKGQILQLSVGAVSGASWSWAGPNAFVSSIAAPAINPAGTIHAGVYSVRSTVNGCVSAWGTVSVSVVDMPNTITAGNSGAVCAGGNVSLSTQNVSGVNYHWSGPGGFNSANQNPGISNIQVANQGLYSVYIYSSGCTSQVATTNVIVNAMPSAPTAGALQMNLCAGDTLSLTASTVSGASYTWSGPNGFVSSVQNPVLLNISTAAAGAYSVYTSIGPCTSGVSTVNIIVNSGPPAVSAGSNSPVCESGSLNFVAGNISGGTYVWTGPNGFTSNLQNPVINPVSAADAGAYTIVVNNGCFSSQVVVQVTVYLAPSAPLASSTSPVCVGDNLSLKATTVPNAVYFWEGPSSFTSTQQNENIQPVSLNDAGIYSVYAIVNGCSSQVAVTTVVVNSPLSLPVLNATTPICEGAVLNLSAQAVSGALYFWSGPNGWYSNAQDPVINPVTMAAAGTYSCYITLGGCTSGEATVQVNVNALPVTPVIIQSGDTLYSSSSSGNQWYELSSGLISGANQDYYVPAVSGTYFVVVDNAGCLSDSSNTIDVVVVSLDAEARLHQFEIYPNPGSGFFHIRVPEGLQEFILEVRDMNGRRIYSHVWNGGVTTFNLPESVVSGVYQLRLITESGAINRQIIIRK